VPGVKGAVLIVDDNEDAADLLGEILTVRGYDVRVAHRSADALTIVASFAPDIAMLDLGLPVMDGFELARRIHDLHPHAKLIAVTGYGQPDDRERTAAAGFAEHLLKPVSIASVTAALARLCR
jgi:CheY-like chemotaxis protein